MEAALPELMAYCQADPDFFEPPWLMRDQDELFPVSRRPLPAGWERTGQGLWTVWTPPAGSPQLPEQGWKIHVSATPDTAARVSDLIADHCLAHGTPVKFLRSPRAMRLLNSKYAERGSSGKLITLYPADEAALAVLLPELAVLLNGFEGPYVLSDLRYEDTCLYVRYGAFREMTCTTPDGETVPAMRTPDGTLVPDRRNPFFTVPAWVQLPDVLRTSMARRATGGAAAFPYRIEKALHFSNGGGVYLARGKDTDRYVVLLEARPHAGLDQDGADAVARLARQRDVLERLAGLPCVPRVFGHLVVWEHHYLVEEFIEGTTLMDEVAARYPLTGPDPQPAALAAYTRWATGLLARVDQALAAVHSRGVRMADVHPKNVIVRPDGSVVLIDFEIATDLADTRPLPLGAPGFAAPDRLSGAAADRYALEALRQWMFLPLSPLQDRDPEKFAALADAAAGLFPLPPGFGPRMARHFRAVHGGPPERPGKDRLFDRPEAKWPQIRDSLVAGIKATATPDRTDRLFPGDPRQFATGPATVTHGAAGVLWALHQAGEKLPAEYTDWLVAAARRDPRPRPGLWDGQHGVAMTLDALGRRDDALEALHRARALHGGTAAAGLQSGLAGAVVSLLHFARTGADAGLAAEAAALGHRLATAGTWRGGAATGLQHGPTGVAYAFLALYETTREDRWLDLAGRALREEAAGGRRLGDGTFQLLHDRRWLAYLGPGSSGLALVLARYLAHRPDPALTAVVDGVRRACRAPFVLHPFLFMGRAGIIAALALLGRAEDRPVLEAHIRRLGWHALEKGGELAFPGHQLLRISMDLATGSAGVLAALGAAFDPDAAAIPFLDLRTTAGDDTERR
ncbi:class III lanthionine synthetase LanKC [Streptomyces bambusae]|uniref:class III lanthionine synthetase LanKC n=1 Tax=Streptomyces bambusae TaxID=1550616 RepID=UPI001CFC5E59|nr:class III lanthionine synthetase LanKC [Streptomyces bambusae]MCB5168321.1 class III lanthionine synthetase LanKC [Streptomyces bambusae]